jgi:hypothetical protein
VHVQDVVSCGDGGKRCALKDAYITRKIKMVDNKFDLCAGKEEMEKTTENYRKLLVSNDSQTLQASPAGELH